MATGHPDSVSYGGATYYRVGGGFTTQTPTGGDGSVDLNKGNGGDDLYLMATADRAAGPALTSITKSQSGSSGTAQSNLTNNGYSVVTNQNGGAQDTNKGAGGDYNYCGQKSSCTTVSSDALRTAYAMALETYNNNSSATVTALWDAILYSLTIDPDGGDYDGETTVTGIICETVGLAAPTREGYSFLGWTASIGTLGENDASYTFAASDAALTANWQAIDYTLTVDAAGGEYDGDAAVSGHIGDVTELTVPTRDGYDFDGWTADNGTVSGNLYTFSASDATVTAGWVIRKYTVRFVNPVTGDTEKELVEHGDGAEAPEPASPVYGNDTLHYVFSGWDRSFSAITSDITISAVYRTEGHDWELADRVAPVCEGEGSETYVCACGAQRTDILGNIGHNWSDVWQDNGNLETHTRVCLNDAAHKQTESHTNYHT